jgi:cytochrome d ubiquinol oxidase subunit II
VWVALGVALVSLATPLASETVRDKWFGFAHTLWLMVLPISSVAAGIWVWRCLRPEIDDWKPFAGAVAIYVLAFLGLAYSIFPFIVVDRMTIWDAASHSSALEFMLWGTAITLPLIVGYTVFSYRVFRGKVREALYKCVCASSQQLRFVSAESGLLRQLTSAHFARRSINTEEMTFEASGDFSVT